MKKLQEEREIDDIIKAQAANTVMWQKAAQAGQEMKKWVEDGHWAFIQSRILNPLEMDCFKKVKNVRLNNSSVAQIAKVQGTLEVFDKISARIENAIQTGQDALAQLEALKSSNSTLKEGE